MDNNRTLTNIKSLIRLSLTPDDCLYTSPKPSGLMVFVSDGICWLLVVGMMFLVIWSAFAANGGLR